MAKLAQCKRCGSTSVAWVQSKRTGKWYLAFARTAKEAVAYTDSGAHGGREYVSVAAHMPHKCDDPMYGGYNPCPLCNKPHFVWDPRDPNPEHCKLYA